MVRNVSVTSDSHILKVLVAPAARTVHHSFTQDRLAAILLPCCDSRSRFTENRYFSEGLELEAVNASRKTDKEFSVCGHVQCGVCNVLQSHQT